ncbi:MAG TPA: hypothetical protein VFR78_07830 [Pyrinomonadaceae bacterium]|nr:hypothetical protein [Pyrinomonadaceae bacterium]
MATAVRGQQTPKTDPELLRQITAAKDKKDPVVGILRIRPEDPTKKTNSPERTKEIANEVVNRVSKKVGSKAGRINVLGNLGVIILSAPPRFMTEVLQQPEIFSAMANRSSESGKIEPINKHRVSESAINRPVNGRSSKSSVSRPKGVTAAKSSGRKSAKKR